MSASLTHIRLSRPRAMARPRALSQEERDRKLAEQESYRIPRTHQNADMQSRESGAESEGEDDKQGESHLYVCFFDIHHICS